MQTIVSYTGPESRGILEGVYLLPSYFNSHEDTARDHFNTDIISAHLFFLEQRLRATTYLTPKPLMGIKASGGSLAYLGPFIPQTSVTYAKWGRLKGHN